MECFSIDESGYPGFDLLNVDQTFQGASAVCINRDEVKRLVNEYFPKLQATELKYSALARKEKNLERMIELQREILRNYVAAAQVFS